MRHLSPIIAALLAVAAGSLLFFFIGHNPIYAFHVFFILPVSDLYGLGELCLKTAPILLCAVGLAIGFRANVWNIGAEGQLIAGAICGGGLALYFDTVDSAWLLPAMFIVGGLGGLAWASLAAFLRIRFNANEILVTLMLTYIAGLFLSYLVYGPWRSPTGFNWPESTALHDAARLPRLIAGTRLNVGIVVALGVAVAAWLFVRHSFISYQMEVGGKASRAARYAGFGRNRMIWLGLLISGFCAGLAGVVEVAGTIGKLREVVSPGYGFAAIIVAYIGRLNPLAIILASLLMALFFIGGEQAKVTLGVPTAITGIFQGTLLFFLLLSDLLVSYRVRWTGLPVWGSEQKSAGDV
jgi:simple sugar transport system permease protein